MYATLYLENLTGRNPNVEGRIILKRILARENAKM
jgi:hypothetical protein